MKTEAEVRRLSKRIAFPLESPDRLPPVYRCYSCGFRTYSDDCSETCPRCKAGMEEES